MKRYVALLTLLFLLFVGSVAHADVVTVDAFVSADDVTIAHLEQMRTRLVDGINNFDGANVQDLSIAHTKLDANADPVNRWDEAFNDFVYTGLLPGTGTFAAAEISAGTAYIRGVRVVKDAILPGAGNLPATSYVWVDLSSNGTYTYPNGAIGSLDPAVTANSMRLARLTTNATDVTTVRDDRVTSINLTGGAQEDFQKEGFGIIYGSTTEITVDAGILYNGTTRISKTTQSPLTIGTAGDYIGGVSENGANKPIFVYVGASATVKLDDNAPDYHDTSGDTTGDLYYYKNGANYWRCLGWLTTDASSTLGSSAVAANLQSVTSTDIGRKFVQSVFTQTKTPATLAGNIPYDTTIPQITEGQTILNRSIVPTSATSRLKVEVMAYVGGGNAGSVDTIALFQDTTANAVACTSSYNSAGGTKTVNCLTLTYWTTSGSVATKNFRVNAGVDAGTCYLNGDGTNNQGSTLISSITVTEYRQ